MASCVRPLWPRVNPCGWGGTCDWLDLVYSVLANRKARQVFDHMPFEGFTSASSVRRGDMKTKGMFADDFDLTECSEPEISMVLSRK